MTYTVLYRNSLLGRSNFTGTFDTEDAAKAHADARAAMTRSFMTYEVWTGTPRAPGKPIPYTATGEK